MSAPNPDEIAQFQALIATFRESISAFAKTVFNIDLSPKQIELCEAFRLKRMITCAGGIGWGKTLSMSVLTWWALITFDEVQISLFGPNEGNLRNGLMKEIAQLHGKMIEPFKGMFDVGATRISRKINPASCYAEMRLARAENPDTARGIHQKNNFVMVDEASGVEDEILQILLNIMTDPNPKLMLVSNPSKASGFFYRTHRDPDVSVEWTRVHGRLQDSPNYDPERFKQLVANYGGPTSKQYRVMVDGEFPLSDEDGLIPKDLIDAAAQNKDAAAPDNAAIIWGLDPAGQGKDSSALCIRQDNVVSSFKDWNGLNPTQLSYAVRDLYQNTPRNQRPVVISVDATGLGYGVYSNLKDFGLPVHQCMFAGTPTRNPEKYSRVRDQLYWELREWLATENVRIPNDPKLIEELAAPKYEDMPKIKIEKKDQIKKRIGRSPDFADALALTFAVSKTRYSSKFNWSKPIEYDWLQTYE